MSLFCLWRGNVDGPNFGPLCTVNTYNWKIKRILSFIAPQGCNFWDTGNFCVVVKRGCFTESNSRPVDHKSCTLPLQYQATRTWLSLARWSVMWMGQVCGALPHPRGTRLLQDWCVEIALRSLKVCARNECPSGCWNFMMACADWSVWRWPPQLKTENPRRSLSTVSRQSASLLYSTDSYWFSCRSIFLLKSPW